MTSFREQIALLDRVFYVCENQSEGVLRRIDENRAILETLRREAPEALRECSLIEDGLGRHDRFFNDLAHAIGMENLPQNKSRIYPRPWPGRD